MLNLLLKTTSAYLSGDITLTELEDWLVANLQNILDSGEQKAIDIANELDADLVEFTEGIIDESNIREHLQGYVITNPIIYINIPTTTTLNTATITDSVPVPAYPLR